MTIKTSIMTRLLRTLLTVGIFETKIEVINGISSAPSTALYPVRCLDPASERRIVDIKFLNDDVLLALCHSKGMRKTVPFVLPSEETDLYYYK